VVLFFEIIHQPQDEVMTKSIFYSSTIALMLFSQADAAQVYIDFSGGNGSPMLLTFSSGLDLLTTSAGGEEGLCIIFDEAGNVLPDGNALNFNGSVSVDSTTYGGILLYSNVDAGAINASDLYFYIDEFSSTLVSSGAEVLLAAGTYTSTIATPWIAPSDGYYEYFLTDGGGNLITTTPVPEPGSVAALAGLAALGGSVIIRRNSRAAQV
jgi:hypothetical protein